MSEQEKFIELRLPCAGLRYVAVLGRRSSEFGFQRCFDPFRFTRIRLADGTKEEIHHLPNRDFVHEIQRVEDGKLVQRYIATLKGDPNLHPISRCFWQLALAHFGGLIWPTLGTLSFRG